MNDDGMGKDIELNGVRYSNWLAKPLKNPVSGKMLAARGMVSYTVVNTSKKDESAEKRLAGRNRTRMRSAKLLDLADRFLCECMIYDRSPTGFRLVLQRSASIPDSMLVCDDESSDVTLVAVAWRRGSQIGVRVICKDRAALQRSGVRAALRPRHYAIAD